MTDVTKLQIAVLIAFALFGLANLGSIERLWGINFLSYFPASGMIIALLSCIIFFIPVISRKSDNILFEISSKLNRNRKHLLLAFATLAPVLILLFMSFPASAAILGDGALRINQIQSSLWWLPTEPLDFLFHAVLFRFVLAPLELSAESCYQWVSAFSGILFVWGAYKLSIYLNPKKWLFNFLFISSSGLSVLFFGYVESYSIAAALIPWVFWTGLKAADKSGSKISFLAIFAIAGLFHPIVAICFSFSAALVVLTGKSFTEAKSKKNSRALVALMIVLITALYAGRIFDWFGLKGHLLGLFPDESNEQGILTLNHWLNVLNWLLIAALPGLVLIPALFRRTEPKDSKNHSLWNFTIWCAVPSFVFLLIFTPHLGGPRDWDLFALPGFTIMLSALAAFHIKKHQRLTPHVLPAIIISLWLVFGFALVNYSPVKSAERQEDIIEIHQFKDLFSEYANLFLLTVDEPELTGKSAYYAQKAHAERPQEWVNVLNVLAKRALEQNDSAASIQYLNFAIGADTANVYGHLLLLNYYNQFESFEKVMNTAQLIERRFPDKFLALAALGVIYFQIDSLDRAEKFYAEAFRLDSAQLDIIINYGVTLYHQHKFERAIEVLRRGLQINSTNFQLNSNLAAGHFEAGNKDSAIYYLNKTVSLAKSNIELQQLRRIQSLIKAPSEKQDSASILD